MSDFTIEEFRSVMTDYIALKKDNPYDYKKWKTSLCDGDSPANRCKGILERLKSQIEGILALLEVEDADVYCCKGACYFPRNPWIGVLFKGEYPTDGVYPCLSLNDEGFFIGCVESVARPQRNFVSRCYTPEQIAEGRQRKDELFFNIDEHSSKKSKWIPFRDLAVIKEPQIVLSFQEAIKDYRDYKADVSHNEVGNNNAVGAADVVGGRPDKISWFDRVPIEDESQFNDWITRMSKEERTLIFRGQGDTAWHLETGIGRSVHVDDSDNREIDVEKIIKFERESMRAFRREIARRSEYQTFTEVDLLALMQHYGSKTRLLDFTFSPLVALYMALEQFYKHTGEIANFLKYHKGDLDKEKVKAIAVWSVEIKGFAQPRDVDIRELRRECAKRGSRWGAPCEWNARDPNRDLYEAFYDEAEAVLLADKSGLVHEGIDIVLPSANNERCSSQEGLFLMPRRMSQSFETNLCRAIKADSSVVGSRHVKKYEFSTSLIEHIQRCLDNFCITAKLIYPDMIGLARSLNKKIDCRV